MLHNLLAGIEEHDRVVLHQPGKRFLNQCSPNPLTHSNGLLQRRAYLFPSDTTDMNNEQPFFPCPGYWTCERSRWPFLGWTSTCPWGRSRGEPRPHRDTVPEPKHSLPGPLKVTRLRSLPGKLGGSKIYLFFNWRIIASQNFVVFCRTSTWIRHSSFYYRTHLVRFLFQVGFFFSFKISV